MGMRDTHLRVAATSDPYCPELIWAQPEKWVHPRASLTLEPSPSDDFQETKPQDAVSCLGRED